MSDQLELVVLHRSGGGSSAKKERYTFDFVVNRQSLFTITGASNFDLSGCLSVPQREPEPFRSAGVAAWLCMFVLNVETSRAELLPHSYREAMAS